MLACKALLSKRPVLLAMNRASFGNSGKDAAEAFPLKTFFQSEMLRSSTWYTDELADWRKREREAALRVEKIMPQLVWTPEPEEELEAISTQERRKLKMKKHKRQKRKKKLRQMLKVLRKI